MSKEMRGFSVNQPWADPDFEDSSALDCWGRKEIQNKKGMETEQSKAGQGELLWEYIQGAAKLWLVSGQWTGQ